LSDDTTPARADVKPGDKVAGYLLEEQIGQGGMAVVYRAYDERLDRRVALKVLAPTLAADTAFRTRFIRESRAAAAVDHPNIIPVYDAGDAGGCLFISMRYVQGGDVRALLADGRALPPARVWNIVSQVAAALDAAHAHFLVHRDVKPANMLLDRPGKVDLAKAADENVSQANEHVYLSDFGISKQTVASNLTSTGQFVGTLDYIAPEQIEGQGIDGRADQYSLACTAFELLCGAPPFKRSNGFALINSHLSEKAPPITTLRPGLPPAVDLVLGKAMSKPPGQRYATCAQFAKDLGRALGLVAGPLEVGALPPAGSDSGDPAKPWPATELAQSGPGLIAQGADQPPKAPVVAAAGTPGGAPTAEQGAPDPDTMLAAQQTPPGPQYAQGPQMATGQQSPQIAAGQQMGAGQQGPGQQGSGQQSPGQPWPAGTWPPGQPNPYGAYLPYQTYPQPGGPSAPGWPQYPLQQQPPKRSRGVLIGAVIGTLAVVIAAAVVAVTVLNRGSNGSNGGNQSSSSPATSSSSPATSPASTAQSQATAMSNLLGTSSVTRGMLEPAVSDIENNCSALSGSQLASDVATIRTVASQRQSEYSQAFQLQVGALANGAQLKNGLLDALQASLNADNDYLKWGREEQSGCFPATGSSAFNNAGGWDTQAVNAKTTFASEWNPVAQQYNLPTVNQADI